MLRRGRRVQCDVVWDVSGQGKKVVQLGFALGVRSLDIMDNEILTVAEHHLCLNVRKVGGDGNGVFVEDGLLQVVE